MADIFTELGAKALPMAMILGGMISSFFVAEAVGGKSSSIAVWGGFGLIAAGLYMFATVPVGINTVAKSAFITPSLLQNTQVHTQKYSNPVNDLSHIKPGNRFDLQTNYVMNKPDESFDSRINDMILKEARNLGFGTAGNYPVKMQPYQVKTLIPTTQIEPARDFNTVKMISG